MNLYFLLEDEKSFLKVLPRWLEYMNFGYTRVADICNVQQNDYVLQSGQGVSQLVDKVLFETIDTILLNPGKVDILVVMLDAEELEIEERVQEVKERINNRYGSAKLAFDIAVLVCNHCFETWLLGCCGIYPNGCIDEKSDFYQYYCHYNIEESDPEGMKPPVDSRDTTARYHFHYLHELLRYKRIRYSKNRPNHVATEEYFNGIVERVQKTGHLKSFQCFYDFIVSIREN